MSHPAGNHLIANELRSWEEVRRDHDALFVMDKDGPSPVSVLCRREAVGDWKHHLGNLLLPSDEPQHQTAKHMRTAARELDRRLIGVSPTTHVDTGGRLTQGWRTNTLLQATSLMNYLDATGRAQLRESAAPEVRLPRLPELLSSGPAWRKIPLVRTCQPGFYAHRSRPAPVARETHFDSYRTATHANAHEQGRRMLLHTRFK